MRSGLPSRPKLPVVWAFLFLFPSLAGAQSNLVHPRVVQAVDENQVTVLEGNTHPLARPEFDRGPAPPDLPMQRMLLVLKRSPEQEAALQQLLDAQQDRSSPQYHAWLTPDQFGQQFGPADQDIQAVVSWLTLHGFEVARVGKGRTAIEFSGTAGQVQEAFHTAIHQYLVNGEQHWANTSDPQIPAALAPVVAGVNSLHDFAKRPAHHVLGGFSRSKATGKTQPIVPGFTFNNPSECGGTGECYSVGPYDFATIYNVLPLWNATPPVDGTGESIAIVGESNINIQDIRDFRNLFGLPANDPQIIVDGRDPGLVSGDETESDLDIEWAGAVAKGATIKFVTSATTNTESGIDLSAFYIVDNNLAPILSESYLECELFLGTAGNQFYNTLWEQAAAQGITVLLASGDEGSAVCNVFGGNTPSPASLGLAVNGLASTPFNVAVGGTDFQNFGANFNNRSPSPYWSVTNDLHHASALGYIPETTWNSSCTNNVFIDLGWGSTATATCNNAGLLGWVETLAGSGGASNCIASNGAQVSSCTGGYAKPNWQTGPGVPNDGARDVPDVSLFASNGFAASSYILCEADLVSGNSCNLNSPYTNFLGFGGTSVSVQAFAGIMALVNQFTTSTGQGNPNYALYKLPLLPSQTGLHCDSSAGPASGCIFNDVTAGTISVPCSRGSPNCVSGPTGSYGILSGYNAGSGYDLATGLGSMNVWNLVQNWSSATFVATTTSLTLNNNQPVNITHGQSVPVRVTVTSNNGTPTGNVSLLASSSNGNGVDGHTLSGNGTASWQTNQLPGGSYSVFAHYAGDGVFGASTSTPAIPVTVAPESSTTTVLANSVNPLGQLVSLTSEPYGSPFSLQANVTGMISGGASVPTGCITFTDNGAAIPGSSPSCPFPLNGSGYATTPAGIFTLGAGTHAIGANYGGDNNFAAGTAANSAVVTVTQAGTSLAVTGPFGGTVSTTAQFSIGVTIHTTVGADPFTGNYSGAATPSGTVTLFSGTTQLGAPIPATGSVNPNTLQAQATIPAAQFTGSQFPAGANQITVVYSGDANYAGASAGPLSFTTVALSTVTTVTTANTNLTLGANTAFTVQVAPANTGGPPVTGNVALAVQFQGGQVQQSSPVALSNGSATISIALTSAGSNTVVATYSGDSNYASSTGSIAVSVAAPPPDFSFAANPSNPGTIQIAAPGQSSAPLTLVVTALYGYNGTINFTSSSCSIAPSGSLSTCGFSPASVTGSGSTQVTINTTAPVTSVLVPASRPPNLNVWLASGGFAAALIFAFGFPVRRRRRWGVALGIAALALLAATNGCGSGNASGAGAGGGNQSAIPGTPTNVTYTVTVTATATGGQPTHTTSFTFVVQ